MKKISLLLFFPIVLCSQNLQLHYDFGQDRHYVTSTLEMFKPDETGAWFWFVDFDYNTEKKSANLAYWEIARYFALPVLDKKLSFKIEYNDGFFIGDSQNDGYWGAPFYNAWLTGFGYNVDIAAINVQTDLLFRYMPVSDCPDWQLTVVWSASFLRDKILLVGYFDLWTQDLYHNKEWIFQAEPQLWYMKSEKFGIGGEVEISRALLYDLYQFDWKFMPTLGLRWNF
ncbi:DUF5020 family protein [candidate division KSB1 bacterium]|nr:DUF5020 family protein [candidate division KSB1 bacterium]RQW01960.1 MAG: DUF5020 family protein [candidate division KSB1 bacterium]